MKRTLFVCLLATLLGSGVVVGEDHPIMVGSNFFSPADLTIAVGDTVTWTNQGGFHNVESVTPGSAFRCANGCDDDGGDGAPSSNPWSVTRIFRTQAEIDYFCVVHSGLGMTGNLTVVGIFGDGFESGDTSAW